METRGSTGIKKGYQNLIVNTNTRLPGSMEENDNSKNLSLGQNDKTDPVQVGKSKEANFMKKNVQIIKLSSEPNQPPALTSTSLATQQTISKPPNISVQKPNRNVITIERNNRELPIEKNVGNLFYTYSKKGQLKREPEFSIYYSNTLNTLKISSTLINEYLNYHIYFVNADTNALTLLNAIPVMSWNLKQYASSQVAGEIQKHLETETFKGINPFVYTLTLDENTQGGGCKNKIHTSKKTSKKLSKKK